MYLIRHGSTSKGTDVKDGWNNDALDDVGTETAKTNALHFAQNHIKVQAVYSSDLARTMHSAAIIGNVLNVPIKLHKELREFNFAGQTKETVNHMRQRVTRFLANHLSLSDAIIMTHKGIIREILRQMSTNVDPLNIDIPFGTIFHIDNNGMAFKVKVMA